MFQRDPKIYTDSENLLAKKEFARFFSNEFKEDLHHFLVEDDHIIYQADSDTRTIYPDVIDQFLVLSYRIMQVLHILLVVIHTWHYYLGNLIPSYF
jgi:hypothetical protein